MTNYEAIELLFEEHVFVDDYHRKPGYSSIIEHLAGQFDALEEKIAELEAKLADKETE
jgi:hypothetical protein